MILLRDNIDSVSDLQWQEMLRALPAWRREQALRFKFKSGQVECASAYLLLCNALQQQYGITEQPNFLIGEHGKPSLPDFPHIHFNISHCKYAVAVIVGCSKVGIDVERIRKYDKSLARYTMNDDEMDYIQSHPNPELAFTRLWTQKEAVCKALGTGITDQLQNLLMWAQNNGIHTHTNDDNVHKGYIYSWSILS